MQCAAPCTPVDQTLELHARNVRTNTHTHTRIGTVLNATFWYVSASLKASFISRKTGPTPCALCPTPGLEGLLELYLLHFEGPPSPLARGCF